ncbi:MAG: cupin domain-containing protein [Chitinivibrionales bacterium]|nr:cupin domain-containing protein [Chitinivibrionales bacterium]
MFEYSKNRLIKAEDIKNREAAFSHPWNKNSQIFGVELGVLTGLGRTGVNILRIPGGKESFVYHSHSNEEEWIYILAGKGIAEIDEEEYEVGPGDFMGFPIPSAAHHLRNPFNEDLLYLVGGEIRDLDIAEFPKLGKVMLRRGDDVQVYNQDDGREFGPLEES